MRPAIYTARPAAAEPTARRRSSNSRTGSLWTEEILHSFNHNKVDGYYPYVGVAFEDTGNLYRTAGGGAAGDGAVFEITP